MYLLPLAKSVLYLFNRGGINKNIVPLWKLIIYFLSTLYINFQNANFVPLNNINQITLMSAIQFLVNNTMFCKRVFLHLLLIKNVIIMIDEVFFFIFVIDFYYFLEFFRTHKVVMYSAFFIGSGISCGKTDREFEGLWETV